MRDPTGEADNGALRVDFDRRLLLQFRRSVITSDAGLLPYRELDDAVGLTDAGADTLADARTGKNGRHRLAGLPKPRPVFRRVHRGLIARGKECGEPPLGTPPVRVRQTHPRHSKR
jgi:hypothetical protein